MADVPESIAVSDAGFTLPTSEILTGRGFITGKSGSGKSNTASVIAEELLEHGFPLLVVDTDGEYYGLKGRYELLHVGAGADCDATVGVEHAGKIAELALVQNVPIILDISGYLEETESRELVRQVVERLFVLGKQVRKPFLVFVEEIHEFLPETGKVDDLANTLVTVAKRGRKRGIGICGMSQRPAAVDKDYITQCDWIVWHRLTWDNDLRVVSGMLGSEVARDVDDLDDGEALLMTDWDDQVNRVRFRRKRTFDAGATPGLDDFESGSFSPVRSELITELSGEGTDLNAVDLEELAAGRAVPDAPEPATDEELAAAAEAVTGRGDGDDDRAEATAEVRPAGAGQRSGSSDVVTISSRPASRPTYAPPEPAEDETFDPVWELGHLTVYIVGRLGGGVTGVVNGVVLACVRFERAASLGIGRLAWGLHRGLMRPAVRGLERIAARGSSDRAILGAIVVLLAATALLLLAT